MKIVIFGLLAFIAFFGVLFLLSTQLNYFITSRALKITLFGITVRKIDLVTIRYVTKRKVRFSEYWCNSFDSSHRLLTIKRSNGPFRSLSISPKNRYVFLAELEDAMEHARKGLPKAELTPVEKEEVLVLSQSQENVSS